MTIFARRLSHFLMLVTLLLLGQRAHAAAPYNAAPFGNTVPMNMTTGHVYSLAVTMRNTGSQTWTDEDGIALQALPNIWGMSAVSVSSEVGTGGTKTFFFDVTAPAPGHYTATWRMAQNGDAFGTSVLASGDRRSA